MTPFELILLIAAAFFWCFSFVLILIAKGLEDKALRFKALADDRLTWALHGMDLWLKAKERIAELEAQLKEKKP
jgi:hypothetical protein